MLPAKCQRNIIPLEIYSNDCAGTIGFYEFERASIYNLCVCDCACVCEFIVNYDNGAHTHITNEIK